TVVPTDVDHHPADSVAQLLVDRLRLVRRRRGADPEPGAEHGVGVVRHREGDLVVAPLAELARAVARGGRSALATRGARYRAEHALRARRLGGRAADAATDRIVGGAVLPAHGADAVVAQPAVLVAERAV